jgi:hypothetical protein
MRIVERFSAPLPKFHKHRIVFWRDGEGEFVDEVDVLTLDNVKLIKLAGRTISLPKNCQQSMTQKTMFLSTFHLPYGKIQDSWLLDIEIYSEVFCADLISMQKGTIYTADVFCIFFSRFPDIV